MVFLGQQIVRGMQDAGYPAKIFEAYRAPDRQLQLYKDGKSKAGPFQSPHQYWLAVDIIHAKKGWPPFDDPFWSTLNAVVNVVAEKYRVELEHGFDWGWDAAHIEIKAFRDWRKLFGPRELDQNDKDLMFEKILPGVWKDFKKRR